METIRCSHCNKAKPETQVLIVRKKKAGRTVHQNVCLSCVNKTLPNPLRKKVTMLYILVGSLLGLLSYLLAYKVF